MTLWKISKWEYDDGHIYARINDNAIIHVCEITTCGNTDEIGRAIAHAWNVDLAATQWSRELFGDASAP